MKTVTVPVKDTSLSTIQRTFPYLLLWLHRAFWVMGAFIFTIGVLTLSITRTSFRKRVPGAAGLMTLAGITSIGWHILSCLIDTPGENNVIKEC